VTIKEIAEILKAEIIVDASDKGLDIKSACSSDLMSSVLYYHSPDSLLITGLTHPHVITTAEIAGIRGIVFVLNKRPDQKTIELAKKKGIPLLLTPFCTYTASGKLYEAGLPSSLSG